MHWQRLSLKAAGRALCCFGAEHLEEALPKRQCSPGLPLLCPTQPISEVMRHWKSCPVPWLKVTLLGGVQKALGLKPVQCYCLYKPERPGGQK